MSSIIYVIRKNEYVDSLASLFTMSLMKECDGIESVYACMATDTNKNTIRELGLMTDEIEACSDEDQVIVALADSQAAFDEALKKSENDEKTQKKDAGMSYSTIEMAVKAHPRANICQIAVPGEYACEVTKQALNQGLHCVVFSANVPLEQEREMKELAREKGLLCMGPDCGVANINGAAMVLSSINNRGPFGIVGASGCGIQHVAAMLHAMGSGVTQTIGTGGKDLTETVGGITFLMGIDALEEDEDTKYLVLISRKPADSVLDKLIERIKKCRKPVVACFMGADRAKVESSGAIWADSLDDCGQAALSIIGKKYDFDSDEAIEQMAKEAIKGMAPEQKYVRGIFQGGTYTDEAMKTMQDVIGGIHSNCPLSPELALEDPWVSVGNTVVDSGEEEFTVGKPHPTLETSVRNPLIAKEGDDPETAVILMDQILCPPGTINPAEVSLKAINEAREKAKARGGKIAVVLSVLGTDADLQDAEEQRRIFREAGVYVCKSNKQAAQLAAEIIKLKAQEA